MSIERIDLNLLLVLHLVLDEQSVARAARRLHVTPSAVSNALGKLRELLGDPLVTRKGRGIVPTPRAQELAPTIARALRDLDAAVFTATFDAASCTRTFTLAVADAGQVAYGPEIVRRLTAALPLARLRMIGIDSLVSLGDLASSEIDVHVGVLGQTRGLRHAPLFDERNVLIARRRHPVLARRVTARALDSLQHVRVVMVPDRGSTDTVADTYRRAHIRREVVVSVPTFTAAAAIVASSDLVATVPMSLVNAYGGRLGVRVVAGPVPPVAISIALSWHERTHADAASIAFREVVRRAILDARS